jgi:hypothetical protein
LPSTHNFEGGTGQLLGTTPIICGGRSDECRCQAFKNGVLTFTQNPSECRSFAASASLTNSEGKDVLFIAGGYFNYTTLDSTETFDGIVWNSEETENLPIPLQFPCLVKVNSSTLLSIGGRGRTDFLRNTFFYNLQLNKWTSGPFLRKKAVFYYCGILKWKNPETNSSEKIIVVSGPQVGDRKEFVDLLYLNVDGSVRGEWVEGPKLPQDVEINIIIEYNNSLVAIDNGYQLYQLSSPNGPWIKMRHSLNKSTMYTLMSFLVPDEIVNCHY